MLPTPTGIGFPASVHRDPLADFSVELVNGRGILRPGPALPAAARDYLNAYIERTHRYRNISRSPDQLRFSLYQPILNSGPGHRSLFMRLRRKFARDRLPQAATIGITRACQCSCTHCSADYHMESSGRDLTDEDLCAAVEQTIDLGATTLIFLGGEPLLRRGLEKILTHVDQERAQALLFTNGEFLSQDRCRSLKQAGLSGIFVSIDSANPEEHEALRGRKGIFRRITEGVANARDAGLAVAISSYLTTLRVQEGIFEDMMELGRELKVDEVTFFDAIPVGRMTGEPQTAADVGNTPDPDFATTGTHTYLDLSARKLIAGLTKAYRGLAEYPSVIPQSVLTSEIGSSFCFAANTQFYLSSTGQMCPCDFTPLTAGRYPDEDLATLWQRLIQSPYYRRRSKVCRMQDSDFRERTIHRIPRGAILPYPLAELERAESIATAGVPFPPKSAHPV